MLSPAGDMERLEAAIRFGADAVYLGGKEFGMRSSPLNFTYEQLEQAVQAAHAAGVKVYLTCNTVPTNAEARRIEDHLRTSADCGVDAFIVADIGVLAAAKRVAPQVDVHISTQAGVVNYLTARTFYEMGASRVVLARELSLTDIAELRAATPPQLQIEAFVHGAMCVSFSGRCLLSHYLIGRDANRGECAQPCRWRYHLVEERRPGEYFPISEEENGTYILNAKDLSMIEHIDQLAAAGVDSFKIEGRAKSAYYVAVVTNAYRNAIDLYLRDPQHYTCPQWLVEETRKVSHRAYSTGFYLGHPQQSEWYEDGGYVREYDVVATVDGYRDGRLLLTQRNRFFRGDVVEVLMPRAGYEVLTIEELFDEEGSPLECAPHPMQRLQVPSAKGYPIGSILRMARQSK